MEKVDCVVIGAGVVGLAIARALAQEGREVIVLEAESAFGQHTSSRNSEVIHAGMYYPAGSLKALHCLRGKRLLYQYCRERGIPVLGLARELPHEIPHILDEVQRRMGDMPYGIDLMLPSRVPQAASSRPSPRGTVRRAVAWRRCAFFIRGSSGGWRGG